MKMKNFILLLIAMAVVSSCQTYSAESFSYSSYEKTQTAEQIGKNGFIIKTVKDSETLSEYSKEVFGKGTEWRKILKENPFLDNPERTYYDQARKKWIVILYKGESIRIRGQVVHPSYTSTSYSASSFKTFHKEERTSIAWWGWVLIGVGVVSVGGLALMVARASGTSGRSLSGDAHRTSYRAHREVWRMNNGTILDVVHTLNGREANYNYELEIEKDGALRIKANPE